MGGGFEETNSGFRKSGDWKEISEFGERIEQSMRESGVDDETLERFHDWRPKIDEAEKDMRHKTVEQATEKEKEIGERSKGVRKDLKNASGKAAEAGKKVASREKPDEEIIEASDSFLRPLYSRSARLLRRFERKVYSRLMLNFNPYYLDTEELNVDLRGQGKDYRMDVNFPMEETRRKVSENLRDSG